MVCDVIVFTLDFIRRGKGTGRGRTKQLKNEADKEIFNTEDTSRTESAA